MEDSTLALKASSKHMRSDSYFQDEVLRLGNETREERWHAPGGRQAHHPL